MFRKWIIAPVIMVLLIFVLFIISYIGNMYTMDEEIKYRAGIVEQVAVPGSSVSCFILTTADGLNTRVSAIRTTWGRRMDHYTFIYTASKASSEDFLLPLPLPEGKSRLMAKVVRGFIHLYNHWYNTSEWFMKVDDDTYVIVENLKKLLSTLRSDIPQFIGYRFTHEIKSGHMSGGAGYLLSKAALKIFVEQGCHKNACGVMDGTGDEDVMMTKCMNKLGVPLVDALDEDHRVRLHPFDPWLMFVKNGRTDQGVFHYRDYIGNKKVGPEALSPTSITFHHLSPSMMYLYEYLIYDLNVNRSTSM